MFRASALTKLVVILSELSIADCAIFVDDTSYLYNTTKPGGVTTELDDLHFSLYIGVSLMRSSIEVMTDFTAREMRLSDEDETYHRRFSCACSLIRRSGRSGQRRRLASPRSS